MTGYQIGEEKRNYRMTLDEQLECLAEDYEGFDWISVSNGTIRFYYTRKRCA